MKKHIDIEKIFIEKNPKLYKKLPKFIIKFITKKIREKEINQHLNEFSDYKNYDFCEKTIEKFELKVTPHGIKNIPAKGGIIFVSNHPLGGMDAISIVSQLKGIRDDIKFIVNDILVNLDCLKDMFVGINKVAKKTSKSSLDKVEKLFQSDNAIFLFPAGLVSRRNKNIIEDLEWKKTFVTKARKYNKTVVPIYIDGKLSNFFYNFSKIRSRLGVKSNLEMLFLSDELFKQKGKSINIYFGKPLNVSDFDNKLNDTQIANEIKKIVYNLPNNN